MEKSNLDDTFDTGGEDELRCAIELYGYSILKYCHNILCDYFEAQDVVQITFIKAYKKRKSFKRGTSLSAWLYRIAYTTCMDFLRKKKLLFFMPQYKTNKNELYIEDDFIRDDLKAALLTLSPKDRALVFSRIIDQKSYKDLEDIYNTSSDTLRKRYERAKKKVAKVLKETNPYYKELEEIK
ncbi:RNA polymerase sigma factor [Inediibacterium massiliense]|uniref:RNA polymerase sigma factor n=1 Tax=Inediibacterium massiliense TaxID=1658111 RepID=UPI0006B6576A|nr:sigma-70 family RNA polymerase sigma factor [Inediibacterium massiliense]